jgi:hypothetical protein
MITDFLGHQQNSSDGLPKKVFDRNDVCFLQKFLGKFSHVTSPSVGEQFILMLLCGHQRTKKTLTKQAAKDQMLTDERVRRNHSQWAVVQQLLQQYFGPALRRNELLVVARQLKPLTLDRLAKRSRNCLLCWFCENWPDIEPRLPSICFGNASQELIKEPIPSPPAPGTAEELVETDFDQFFQDLGSQYDGEYDEWFFEK